MGRPLQFSLLTAIVFMLTAGLLMGLNLTELTYYRDEYGWPNIWLILPDRRFSDAPCQWHLIRGLRNAVCWFAILLDVCVLCERFVRREWRVRDRLPLCSTGAVLAMVLTALSEVWDLAPWAAWGARLVCGTAVIVAVGLVVEEVASRLIAEVHPRHTGVKPPKSPVRSPL